MSSRTWYRIALAGGQPGDAQVVVAPGAHLGDAIANGVRHVGRGAWAAAVAVADATEVPLGEAFGKHEVVARGTTELATGLRWPLGIVPSFGDASRAAALHEGWARRKDNVIEAVVDGPKLDEALMSIVEKLPAADNLEVRVMDHHDGAGTTEVWLTPRIDVKRAIRMLDDNDIELLHNGHVELSIYLRAQRSTLRLTEHKTIAWLSEDEALTRSILVWLGLEERPELATLAQMGHFHWRPAATQPRRRLIDKLKRMQMRLVDSWKA
ncbi:MAG TPA: hypothetical protein VL463_28600 [Kofleriaceae bacterium]|nr:hypothetical protein [Kofleriaceae bacterium]